MANSTLKNYLEAGMQFTEMSKKQAEAFVSNLVQSGDVRRKDAERMVESVIRRSRETSERLAAVVQAEVAKQLKAFSARFDEVEQRVEAMAASVIGGTGVASSGASRTSAAASAPAAATTGGAKTSSAKKSAAQKSTAKKSGAKKKSTATKSGAKKKASAKSTAKKSTAKKSTGAAVGSSGVRKVSTTRPS